MAKKAPKQKGTRRVVASFTNTKGEKVVSYSDKSQTKNGIVSREAVLPKGMVQKKDEEGVVRTVRPGSKADTKYETPVKDVVGTPMITSDRGKSLVTDAMKTESRLSPITANPDIITDAGTGTQTEAITTPVTTATAPETKDFKTFVNETTGQEYTLRGEALTPENIKAYTDKGYVEASGDISTVKEAPEIQQAKRAVMEAQSEVDMYLGALRSNLVDDKELRAEVRSIESAYRARAKTIQNINERRAIAMNTLGIRLGGRYTGGTGGIMGSILSEEERQGQMRIAELEGEKQGKIAEARKNAREHNYGVYVQLMNQASKIQDQKAQELKTLKEEQRKQDEKIAEQNQQAEYDALIIEQLANGVTDPLEMYKSLRGQVPFDKVKEFSELLPEELKPVVLGKSDTLVDPKTGKVIARGIGEEPTGGGGFTDPEAQYWATLINQGKAKLENAPEKLRSAIVAVLAGGDPVMSKANEQAVSQAQTAITAIDTILTNIKEAGTFERFALAKLPGTLARDTENTIETVQALIGFDALAQMRAASPTGGALGSITEKELRYLQSVQGSLDPLQSTKTLKTNLDSIRKSFARIRAINSVETTPEEYKKQFPEATEDELQEIRARNTTKKVQDNATMTNKDLFNTGSWSTQSSTPMSMDVFSVIGLEE